MYLIIQHMETVMVFLVKIAFSNFQSNSQFDIVTYVNETNLK